MNKLNVGDFVRTKEGYICKILEIHEEYDDEYLDWNDIHSASIRKSHIIKSSPRIIDLIEVGDHVNSYLVIKKPYTYHDIQFVSVDTQDSWKWGKGEMPVENIKSIVTKEQFSQIEYKVGE